MDSLIFYIIFISLLIIIILIFLYINKNIEKYTINNDPITTGDAVLNNVYNSTDKYIQFNSSGTITFKIQMDCDILVVGGGGSGGGIIGGGGGGGAVIYILNSTLEPGTYSVIVGNGGARSLYGNNGEISSFAGIIAEGGGCGNIHDFNGYVGGSGGGAGANFGTGYITNAGIKGNKSSLNDFNGIIYGNNGGNGLQLNYQRSLSKYTAGGGGGGAGGVGGDGNEYYLSTGGKGGNGILINITGIDLYWGAGGGGSQYKPRSYNGRYSRAGNGGTGGGGGGASLDYNYNGYGGTLGLNNGETSLFNSGGNGGINTGSGGGGGYWDNSGGAGGSGVVIIRFRPKDIQSRITLQDIEDNLNNDITTELIKFPVSFPIIINDVIGVTINNYLQTFLINNLLYMIKFSSYDENYKQNTPLNLFDSDHNNGGFFSNKKTNRYNIDNGEYLNTSIGNFKDEGVNEKGEWVSIQFPIQFTIKYYGFICIDNFENLAPGKWKLYAKQNNIYILIDDCTTSRLSNIDYKNNLYKKAISPDKQFITDTYVFVFKALASSDINAGFGNKLNFREILLIGQ